MDVNINTDSYVLTCAEVISTSIHYAEKHRNKLKYQVIDEIVEVTSAIAIGF